VPRDGFPGISSKEIGRIERGEIVRPHAATLRVIADTLGVEPVEIETF
jgi:transcriptional regulator with XRE-family HTH domain